MKNPKRNIYVLRIDDDTIQVRFYRNWFWCSEVREHTYFIGRGSYGSRNLERILIQATHVDFSSEFGALYSFH